MFYVTSTGGDTDVVVEDFRPGYDSYAGESLLGRSFADGVVATQENCVYGKQDSTFEIRRP